MIALNFPVAVIPVKPRPRDIKMTVAWQTVMPKFNSEGEVVSTNEMIECNIGNQTSVQNDLVWGNVESLGENNAGRSRQSFKVMINATVSSDKNAKIKPALGTGADAPQIGPFKPQPSPYRQPSPSN